MPRDHRGQRRIGAYILPGDPVWLASSLSRYYSLLDALVVVVPRDGRGWTGRKLPVEQCLEIVRIIDVRGIATEVTGRWENREAPMRADTAQRQAGIDALESAADWVLQIDNDEILPNIAALLELFEEAERRSLDGVEWPMRVLFRRLGNGDYLEVCAKDRRPRYDYPGPIAVRSGATTIDARRCAGTFLRPTVLDDDRSLQLQQPLQPGETRLGRLFHSDAIIHNSWGREPAEVHQKIRSWGHASGARGEIYYWAKWMPAPLLWRVMRDFHPFARGLWPRLCRSSNITDLLASADR